MNRLSTRTGWTFKFYNRRIPFRRQQGLRFPTVDTTVIGTKNLSSMILPSGMAEYIVDGSLWSPVNLTAQFLDHLHVFSGTSWPVTIFLFTFGLRSALFPFTVLQTRSSILANNLRPELEKLRSESTSLRQKGRLEQAKMKMMEFQNFTSRNKIGVGRLLGLGLLPVPFFMSAFFALRAMTSQQLPSMLQNSFAWIHNMCLADPYFILPTLTTISLLLSLEVRN